ncbi:hypothetical protein I5U25_06540 [Stenotrophomonas maltophilia]|nr:hypothetical protein [Stenotrophomonas maltophilia]
MDLYLVLTDPDFTIKIPLPQDRSSQIASQLSRIHEQGDRRGFQIRLAEEVAKIIPELTDSDLKPPSKAQLAFAKSMCKQLNCEIPMPAIYSRTSMHRFLSDARLRLRAQQSSQGS